MVKISGGGGGGGGGQGTRNIEFADTHILHIVIERLKSQKFK